MREADEFKRIRQHLRRAAKTPVPKGLIEQIRAAFADTVMPDATALVTCPCDECSGIKRRFANKHWTEITDPRNFHMMDVSLALMTPDAFRFYLPAFLLGDLLQLGDPEKRTQIGYVSCFTPPPTEGATAENWLAATGETYMEFFLKRVRGFTPEQKEAIRAYIAFTFRRRPALEAIEQVKQQRLMAFWDTFED